MKKFYNIILTILFTLSLSGCAFGLDSPSPPIHLPTEVTSITIGQDGIDVALSEAERLTALEILSSAEPTTRESVNDTPYADEYYVLKLVGHEYSTVVYLYKKERLLGVISRWYLEQPYHAIYEISEANANLLLDMYAHNN